MAGLALVSVYDKTGIEEMARRLVAGGYAIISTGGSKRALEDAGLPVTAVSAVTGFPEILGGRVKSLHAKIHAGLLARRDLPEHLKELKEHAISQIDVVICNLYPFAATIAKPGVVLTEALENIDIGGPAMIRAAAKNFPGVIVVVDPRDYDRIGRLLESGAEIPLDLRRELAAKAFRHTAAYDAAIAAYLESPGDPDSALPVSGPSWPENVKISLRKVSELRYGENPHQSAAFYVGEPLTSARAWFTEITQLGGKELSYNNIADTDAALALVAEFSEPAAVGIKHATPCAAALGGTVEEAVAGMLAADPVSIFGGIVAVNRSIDDATARRLAAVFLEVVAAPGFDEEALALLRKKTNLRLLRLPEDWLGRRAIAGLAASAGGSDEVAFAARFEAKKVSGGYLLQTPDPPISSEDPATWKLVSGRHPGEAMLRDLVFAWAVVKHVRSNAVVVARDGRTLGIGGGQVNRIDAARYALARAEENSQGRGLAGAVMASDAFFPLPDVVEAAAAAGISAIVQPGGSIRDDDSIAAAERFGIAMFFTGRRHFRH